MQQHYPLLNNHKKIQIFFLCIIAALLTTQTTASLIRSSYQTTYLIQQLTYQANLQNSQDTVTQSKSRLLSIVDQPNIDNNGTRINSSTLNNTLNDSENPMVIAQLDNSTVSIQNSTQSNSLNTNTNNNTVQNTSTPTNSSNSPTNTPLNNNSPYSTFFTPKQLDYNLKGLISNDDKKLSFCNSSWAISAAFLYEYSLLKQGITQSISEQAIIMCTTYYTPQNKINNCAGGRFQDALQFLSLVGSVAKKNYPTSSNLVQQSSKAKICTDKNRIFVGEGKAVIMSNLSDDEIKKLLVENGPILVNLYADMNFIQYKSDTFSSCPPNAASQANLTAVLFGYSGNDYWLIKAHFGEKWGNNGIMRLSMSNNCGINSRIGFINYGLTDTNANPFRVFDPTGKYNIKYQTPSQLSQKYLTYLNLCLLLFMAILFL